MAGEMQVLASLNRMLQSKETREQTRMQNALAMMQFAQQKKMADYQLASNQISILQNANQVIQAKQAQQLVSDLGLDKYDVTTEDGLKDAKDDLQEWRGLNLEENEANRIVNAYGAYSKGNYGAMLNLASNLKEALDMPEGSKLSASQKEIFNTFNKFGYLNDKEAAKKSLDAIELSMKNEEQVLQEQIELAKGDTKISTELSSFSVDELADAAEEMDDISETLLINDPQTEIQQLASSIESLEQQIEENQLDLENLSKESETLEIYKKSEQLSEDQKDYYDRLPELKEQIEKEIAQLSGEIDKEKALTKLLEESIEDKKYPFGDATI